MGLRLSLNCVEIDGYAPQDEISALQDLVDRICAMLTKLIKSAEAQHKELHVDRGP